MQPTTNWAEVQTNPA